MSAGIREKKKAVTEKAILDAALKLFTEQGYNETRIEEIAEKALVGVGTVYNYFGSKRGLLLAFSAIETKRMLERGIEFIKNAGEDPEEALIDLTWSYTQNMLKFDKKLMREIFIAAIADPETIGRGFAEDDYRMIGQMAELIEKYRNDGLINPKLPSDKASMVIYSSMFLLFHIFMATEISRKELKKMLKDYMHIIFLGWNAEGVK